MKRSAAESTLSLPYDYGSVMHYRTASFSKDGNNTLEPNLKEAAADMGQRLRFSKVDIAKLNRMYDCPPKYYVGNDIEGIHATISEYNNTINYQPDLKHGIVNITEIQSVVN
jgi:hypothetical protein